MSALEPFAFDGHEVRVVIVGGEPWFVAADVCAALGIVNSRDALGRLEADEKGVGTADTLGGPQQVAIVNEPGVYGLAWTSRRPEAAAFRRWVKHDVLPSIGRTGAYAVEGRTLPRTYRDAVAGLLAEIDGREVAEARVRELEPVAAVAQTLLAADGDWSVREAAQVLNRDPAIATGQNRLFGTLRKLGWIDHRGTPYQRQVEANRIATRVQTYPHPHTGEPTLAAPQVRIKPKGLVALHAHLKGAVPIEDLLADHEGVPA